MKTKKKWLLFAMAAGLLIVFGIASVRAGLEIRHDSLDHALIQAVKNLDSATVKRLLNEGASANAHDSKEPPLTVPGLAARLTARFRRKKISSDSTVPALSLVFNNESLFTAEHIAPSDRIAAALIEHGADIHVRLTYNTTPLHLAARFRMDETVRSLISKGADIDARDSYDDTPLMGADRESSRLLLLHGADIHAKNVLECTPLYFALGDPVLVDLLIARGADVNSVDGYGYSLLYRALELRKLSSSSAEISRDMDETVRLLEQHGARLNRKARERIAVDKQRGR